MNTIVLLLLIAIFLVYIQLGAVFLMLFERGVGLERCEKAIAEKAAWLEMGYESEFQARIDTEEFIKRTEFFTKHGISMVDVRCPKSWDLESSFLTATTMLTKIGYGKLYPTYGKSRTFTHFYAFFGLLIFTTLVFVIREHVADAVIAFGGRLNITHGELVAGFGFGVGGAFFLAIVPAAIFVQIERWSYLESLYYTVITLTTVGFGDFVAGSDANQEYVAAYDYALSFWILIGIAYAASVMELVARAYDNARGKLCKRC